MSEVECSRPPQFERHLPAAIANGEVNRIFRSAIHEAIETESGREFTDREERGEAVARDFYSILGSGAIVTTLQELIQELPDRYRADTSVYDTVLQLVDRVDRQSYAHPDIISPLIGLTDAHGGTHYVGTDKLAHFVQQGYDYHFIYRTVEEFAPGLGELYALSWGLWSEGIELTDDFIYDYLESRNMPSDRETVSRIKNDVISFIEDSDTILYVSPTPDIIRFSHFLCWLADAIGTHKFGVLGEALTGIISYSDLAVNEAGMRFYFDLIADPEEMAQNFDIADYVTPEWDEETLPSTYSPVIEERIEQAIEGRLKSPFVYGFDVQFSAPPWSLTASFPFLYYSWRDLEWRFGLGASLPLTGDETRLAAESMGLASIRMDMRITGLHFAYLNFTAGFSRDIASDQPMDGFHPILGGGWEIMFLGWMSIFAGFNFDANEHASSFVLGLSQIWR